MNRVVIDTDIVIDFLRTNSGLFPQLLQLQADGKIEILFSSITVLEIFAGESAKNQRNELLKLFSKFKIVPFDKDLAIFAGEVKRGKKLSITLTDFIIGTSASKLKARLATRNKTDFKDIPFLKFFELPS